MASRRRFLKLAAATCIGVASDDRARPVPVAPHRKGGTIMDVEHVVIFITAGEPFVRSLLQRPARRARFSAIPGLSTCPTASAVLALNRERTHTADT